jgi:hypothetical protein
MKIPLATRCFRPVSFRSACLILAGLNLLGGPAMGAQTRRLGLMIGANDGGRDRIRLQYAVSDARAFSRSMEDLGGLAPEDRILLSDPDSASLHRALARLAEKAGEAKRAKGRVEAVVYYSGHADEEGLLLRGRRFGFRTFRALMAGVPADIRIAVVDACASGALTKLKGGQALPAFLSDESSQTTGYAYLTSSSANESAQESDRIGASYFTHYLNAGLRGAADASRDGRVTLHEAYQYAYHETLEHTEKTAGGPQHAGYDMGIAGSGDVVMTVLSRSEASVAFPDSMEGRFFIRDSRDRLVAEVRKPAGHPLHLALEAGAYRALWHTDSGSLSVRFTLQKGAEAVLTPGPQWKPVPKEAAQARGDSPRRRDELWDGSWSRNLTGESGFEWFYNPSRGDYRGTQSSLAYNHALGRFHGQQLALAVNRAGMGLGGIQVTAGLNYIRGPLDGVQLSGGANITRGVVEGSQVASGFNVASSLRGAFQGSGMLNVAAGDVDGAQASSGANWTHGSLDGGQIAVVGNYAGKGVHGVQGSLLANVARGNLDGTQFGTAINVTTGEVEGFQVGFLNIARSYRRGAPVGVLSFVGDGVWRGDMWRDETGFSYLGLVTGTRYMQTRIGAGSNSFAEHGLGGISVETAGHLPWRGGFLELGLMSSVIDTDTADWDAAPDYVERVRLTAGVDLGRWISLAAGVGWAFDIAPASRKARLQGNWMQRSHFGGRLEEWPAFHLSLRAGTYGSGSKP